MVTTTAQTRRGIPTSHPLLQLPLTYSENISRQLFILWFLGTHVRFNSLVEVWREREVKGGGEEGGGREGLLRNTKVNTTFVGLHFRSK